MTFSTWPDIHPSWYPILAPVAQQFYDVVDHIAARRADGERIEPPAHQVLRVFQMPFQQVKVLIVGQDPYPTPGHAMGLSFSLAPEVRPLARSLVNIFAELQADLGVAPPVSGDLSAWEAQGVFLLNRVLTVTAGAPGSHQNMGWEPITEAVVDGLAARGTPLVVILWGGQARRLGDRFTGENTLVLTSAHPSPLSARRGFFGSKPFSQANTFLVEHGVEPVDWRLGSSTVEVQPAFF